ncbi:MAG: hypothetical protein JWQ07_2232 [Ramlibacter sp.]|nr:hypothetical protein [Ramlibacter sp.]
MRVIVTRPDSEAQRWVQDLRHRGFDAVALPLIKIAPATQPAALHAAWRQLEHCRAAMFVSGNAVRQFFAQMPPHSRWPASARAWGTGPGTREALIDAGVDGAAIDSPPLQAVQFDSEALWQEVAGQVRTGDRVLIVRGGDAGGVANGRDWLAEQLVAAGARVETVVAYLRQRPELGAGELSQAQQAATSESAWLFSSSQSITHLRELLPQQAWSQARAVATHARIAQAARQAGFGVVCESRPDLDAVVAALESFR